LGAEGMPMGTAADDHAPAGRFATTRWSLVLAAGRRGTPEADHALAALCESSWYPLYAEARRRGLAAEDAGDRVQGFFARLLEGDGLAVADRTRGRFRSFLLAAFGHYLANEWDREHARKRGGARRIASLDSDACESRLRREPAHEATPERIFDRRWALALIERALGRLESEYALAGKAAVFAALKPALGGDRGIPYADLARTLGISEGAVKVAMHRLRARCGRAIRDEVAQTVGSPEEVDDELRLLFAALEP
jgi:DNA-directed RNA polymerase specialized sigma24 family protein